MSIKTFVILSGAFTAGLILGAFYFIALWRTVRKLPDTPSPLRLMLGSFVVRMAVVLPGFYFVMSGHWERLALALAGFILMRRIITRKYGAGLPA
ncbi:MAG: ATP synthase subunit I [Smithellaceae bacterium]